MFEYILINYFEAIIIVAAFIVVAVVVYALNTTTDKTGTTQQQYYTDYTEEFDCMSPSYALNNNDIAYYLGNPSTIRPPYDDED